jgi:hypothetical protein
MGMVRFIRHQPRISKRVSITLSHHIYELLQSQSELQGRSFSNYCAFLLEEAVISMERSRASDSPADGVIRHP